MDKRVAALKPLNCLITAKRVRPSCYAALCAFCWKIMRTVANRTFEMVMRDAMTQRQTTPLCKAVVSSFSFFFCSPDAENARGISHDEAQK